MNQKKKHSDLDIPIRINLDNNLSTFIPRNELMELVEQVKTKLKKTLPVQCMCDEIIKFLNQLPYGKKEEFYTNKVNDELHQIVEAIREQYTHSTHNPKEEEHEKYIDRKSGSCSSSSRLRATPRPRRP